MSKCRLLCFSSLEGSRRHHTRRMHTRKVPISLNLPQMARDKEKKKERERTNERTQKK